MDIGYLNLLPEAENKYNIALQDGEKVIFATNMPTFGTEKDRMIGSNCNFTFTNKRMLVDNHAGIWTVNLAEDLAGCKKVQGGRFIFKFVYFAVMLNDVVVFDHGKQKLSGFHFYFEGSDTAQFEEIMNHLLN